MTKQIMEKDFDYILALENMNVIRDIFARRTIQLEKLEEFSNNFEQNKITKTISFFNQKEDSVEFGFDNIVGRLEMLDDELILVDEFEIWSRDMGYEHPDLTFEDVEHFAKKQKKRQSKYTVKFELSQNSIDIDGENLEEIKKKFYQMPIHELVEELLIKDIILNDER